MKLTRTEKRTFDELAYYTCFGTEYPYKKQTRMLRLTGVAIVGGALVAVLLPNIDRSFESLALPVFSLYIALIIALIIIAGKQGYLPGKESLYSIMLHRNGYIRAYKLLKQDTPGLTVDAFAESIKVFLAAQENQRTEEGKRKTERELAELKQKYDL